MNKVIKMLIFSDFILLSGWGLIAPIFAIFITQQIVGGNAQVAGIAAGIYWIGKSIIQPFVGKYLDRNHGEKDDFWFMFVGLAISATVPLGFLFATHPFHIYLLQFFHALGMALAIPSWGAVFTRHIDKGKEAFDYSMSSTAIGFGAGIAGILGGWAATNFGFQAIFVATSIFTFLSAFMLFVIAGDLFPFDRKVPRLPMEKMPHIPASSILRKWARGHRTSKTGKTNSDEEKHL